MTIAERCLSERYLRQHRTLIENHYVELEEKYREWNKLARQGKFNEIPEIVLSKISNSNNKTIKPRDYFERKYKK